VAKKQLKIIESKGKLGVLTPGMGAVTTTFIAGVEAIRRQLAEPIGSLTQMGTIRLGKRTDKRTPAIKDFVPLARLDDLVFGGWDLYKDNTYEAAAKAGVLDRGLLDQIKDFMQTISPMPAVFEQKFVKRLHGKHVKPGKTKMDLAEQVIDDIQQFRKRTGVERLVMIWCGSTEVFLRPTATHQSLRAFEKGLRANSRDIPPSMIYAYAALKLGIPFANGAPNLTADVPGLQELSLQNQAPTCGKDFKTGQTLMKTIIAPGLKARLLGLSGWFSTNILGNRDGEVLDDPMSFKAKEESKLSALRIHSATRTLSPPLQGLLPQGPH